MKRLPRWLWCVGVPGLGLASQAIAYRQSGWIAIGLNGLLYVWLAALILGLALSRVRQPRRLLRASLILTLYIYPVFWVFCLVTALTGSWVWAIPASVVFALAGLTYRDTVRRRRRRQPATEPFIA